MEKQEKKVEYIELIYDLIFVYIIGRNNHLLHIMENGFISGSAFLTYMVTTLIILQIWYYTTLFVNRYGENDKQMYMGIFVNMYLLYFIASIVIAGIVATARLKLKSHSDAQIYLGFAMGFATVIIMYFLFLI